MEILYLREAANYERVLCSMLSRPGAVSVMPIIDVESTRVARFFFQFVRIDTALYVKSPRRM